jgi:hypothetical protein
MKAAKLTAIGKDFTVISLRMVKGPLKRVSEAQKVSGVQKV